MGKIGVRSRPLSVLAAAALVGATLLAGGEAGAVTLVADADWVDLSVELPSTEDGTWACYEVVYSYERHAGDDFAFGVLDQRLGDDELSGGWTWGSGDETDIQVMPDPGPGRVVIAEPLMEPGGFSLGWMSCYSGHPAGTARTVFFVEGGHFTDASIESDTGGATAIRSGTGTQVLRLEEMEATGAALDASLAVGARAGFGSATVTMDTATVGTFGSTCESCEFAATSPTGERFELTSSGSNLGVMGAWSVDGDLAYAGPGGDWTIEWRGLDYDLLGQRPVVAALVPLG